MFKTLSYKDYGVSLLRNPCPITFTFSPLRIFPMYFINDIKFILNKQDSFRTNLISCRNPFSIITRNWSSTSFGRTEFWLDILNFFLGVIGCHWIWRINLIMANALQFSLGNCKPLASNRHYSQSCRTLSKNYHFLFHVLRLIWSSMAQFKNEVYF